MGPLQGIKVVEMAGMGPAPFCAMMLADMGADVIRVERANAPERGIPIPPRFEVLNRGRRSLALDLKTEEDLITLKALIGKADILLEGYRPGVMERLGVGPQECAVINPKLVYGRMTGFGQDGPLAKAAGHDINYIALTGALSAIGKKDEEPVVPLNLVGDFGGGGMMLAVGLLAAYIESKNSGKGQVVDAAMVDGASLLMASTYGLKAAGVWKGERGTNILDGGAPWYGVYRTADEQYISLAAIEPRFYEKLLDLLGLNAEALPVRSDSTQWPAIREALSDKIAGMMLAELDQLLEGTDACYAPVLSMDEAPEHAHMRSREAFTTVDGVLQPAPAPRFSRTPSHIRCAPPEPGQDMEQVLDEWLGENQVKNKAPSLSTNE